MATETLEGRIRTGDTVTVQLHQKKICFIPVRDYLAESGFDSKYGARPLRRAIQNKLEDPMANEILEGRIRTGDTVKVQLHQKKICFIPVRDTE